MAVNDDIKQIYHLIRASDKAQSRNHLEVCERITAVETKIEGFNEHVRDHKASAKTWKVNAVASVFKICVLAIVAFVTWVFTKMKNGS